MRILCATDLLAKSEAAIARAASISDELGADLTLLHGVVAPSTWVLEARESARLESLARNLTE